MASFQQPKTSRDRRHRVQDVPGPSSSPGVPAGSSSLIDKLTGDAEVPRLPAGIEIRTDEKRGRGLCAKSPFRAGEPKIVRVDGPLIVTDTSGATLLSIAPLQAALSNQNLSSSCSGCFLTPREIEIQTSQRSSIAPCSKCQTLYYCSEVCVSCVLTTQSGLIIRNAVRTISKTTKMNARYSRLSISEGLRPDHHPMYLPSLSGRWVEYA
jgi:hypothetical protein